MTIGVYIRYKLFKWTKDLKKTLTNPSSYMPLAVVWTGTSIWKGDKIGALAGMVIMFVLWLWADYRRGEHTHWWRKKYKSQIEGLTVVEHEDNKDREPDTG